MTDRLLRRQEVEKRLGVSRPTIYRLVAAGAFPQPFRIGTAVRWSQREIEAWLSKQRSNGDRAAR